MKDLLFCRDNNQQQQDCQYDSMQDQTYISVPNSLNFKVTCIIEKYVTNANITDIFLIPKPGPRARRGIRDSHRMSIYDARFHHTFQCLSLNVKDQYWERDLAEHEVWLPNWRRHQAKAGAVRALERGSRLRIPRRRASPMLKEQAEVIKCAVLKDD